MAYRSTWLTSDRKPQFRYEPDIHIEGQKVPHAFLSEALREPPERVPTRGVEITRKKGMFDFVSVSARLCISEDVKAIIEVREPNVHQFFPIELSRHTGDRTEKSYFLLNILTQLDSIVPEKSDMRWSTDPMTGRGYWGEVAPFRLALRHEAIAGRHIWLEKFRSSAFLSDELVNAIEMQS